MKNLFISILSYLLLLSVSSCKQQNKYIIDTQNVEPWCILGFDSLDRTPEQRIEMLQEMGIKKYGYNRGKAQFDLMKQEFDLAKKNNIEITSIFLWLNAKRDSLGNLSPSNKQLLNTLKEVEYKPTIWLSFSNNYFEDLDQKASLALSVDMIQFIKQEADEIGSNLALYNHHGWFGNPYNQLEIIKALKDESISIVYNFHHAQEYVDGFPDIAKKIKPYLSHVNLNGVKKDGPQILTIGQGDHEYDMIKILIDEGYKGPWGILGHIKTEDVQIVLERNINGLITLNSEYKNE